MKNSDQKYSDLKEFGVRDPSFIKAVSAYIFKPGYRTVVLFKLCIKLHRNEGWSLKFLSKLIWVRLIKTTGCYLSPKAKVGNALFVPHATGVVIGDGVEIGDRVHIYQNVTLGSKNGTEYPIIGNDVKIFAGACVIGQIRIGNRVVIGANSVVTKDVLDNCVVAGVPAKVINA
jgi:serine O-acetyltransferase